MELSEIKELLDGADNKEAEASQSRWEAAEAIVAKLDEGFTQVKLAEDLGRSNGLISLYARVWREREEIGENDFQVAYRWVQANPKNPRTRNAPEQPTAPEPREPITRPAPQVNPPMEPERPIRSPAEYKADRALVEEQLAPLKNMINALPRAFKFPCLIGSLEECVESLDETLADPQHIIDGFVTEDDVAEAYSVVGQISERLMKIELAIKQLSV